ncbi:endolytic transglycosylase MltG [Reinekea forsetii]|nr:endolytic transglycosylase MltG [Reinekea forsetii]
MIKKLFLILPLIVLIAILGYGNYVYNQFTLPLKIQEPTLYTVENGSSVRKVLSDFEQKGWMTQSRAAELYLRYLAKTAIQRGDYELTSGLTPMAAIEKMIEGKKVLSTISFIEGHRFSELLKTLASHSDIKQTLTGLAVEEIVAKVSSEIKHPEGWFFPDTYHFEKGTTDLHILKTAYQRTKNVLAQEWENRSDKAAVKTPYDALILASIIEKETGAAFERPMISGVFTRRLKRGMRLQTDPTVIYGLGDNFSGNLTRTHLRTDTPYNTYTRKGLPPTPIASAGREAIFAALNPSDGTTLFFVAKGDGTHYFSTTLEEHNSAVRQYQRFGRREDYQSAPSTEDSK